MKSKITLEFIWWIITAVVVCLIMLPIYSSVGMEYPFYTSNIIFIIIFLTLTRYIFLLRYTPFGWNKKVKAVLVFLPIPLIFYFLDAMYDFQRFLDEDGVNSILTSLTAEEQSSLGKYIRYEKMFFGTAGFITVVMFPIRMIVSLWRQKNRNSV